MGTAGEHAVSRVRVADCGELRERCGQDLRRCQLRPPRVLDGEAHVTQADRHPADGERDQLAQTVRISAAASNRTSLRSFRCSGPNTGLPANTKGLRGTRNISAQLTCARPDYDIVADGTGFARGYDR